MQVQLGGSLPPGDPHGVSVSLPLWQDTVGWAYRDEKVLQKLNTGYPRFFVPRIVRVLAQQVVRHIFKHEDMICTANVEKRDELDALLVPGKAMAITCQDHLRLASGDDYFGAFVIDHSGDAKSLETHVGEGGDGTSELFAVIFKGSSSNGEPKALWQHTGYGISSRCASYWLSTATWIEVDHHPDVDMPPTISSVKAKEKLRDRIAGLLCSETHTVSDEDVWLLHTGMSAIACSAHLVSGGQKAKPGMAIFGFLYVDTFKVLSHIHGFACTLYNASDADLEQLEADLKADPRRYEALYLEFPGNPLLASPDLTRIWKLSREYGFAIVLDDTVGTAVNLDLIAHTDIICTSLTKMFSGACNAMGGSLALNPMSKYYLRFKAKMNTVYLDTYFPPDAVIMEQNSLDFSERVQKANANSELVVKLLKQHTHVEQVYYPKGSPSQSYYDCFRRRGAGYGFLLSIVFDSPASAMAFYNELDVAKGPSLGTNFTLSCAYTLLAHARELEWAAKYGVVEYLVRISVGIEDPADLVARVKKALVAAESASDGTGLAVHNRRS
ncbi:hypothetical protein CERZMDRAFT_104155 [Cercospora zeae-maydis SCOH1-5]|uniref:Cystathionine gamma-synthase n=1 Tax=Cercospora zeae-maydis SCOH1-5 TaxID=717836 RepID=A0A6A6FV71_9PEZI|nr:hypothetical protein CERZMDRAFT_104155 [Cercospora zeae-maydis SCOH1-5]